MTNFRIHAERDFGQARIVLTGDGRPVGMATVTMDDYGQMWRRLMTFVLLTSREVISSRLADRLWQDAQSTFDLSPELAKQKLLEFGWSSEKITAYADELSREIVAKLAESMPGSG